MKRWKQVQLIVKQIRFELTENAFIKVANLIIISSTGERFQMGGNLQRSVKCDERCVESTKSISFLFFFFLFFLKQMLNLNEFRNASFKEDEGTWKRNEDGKVVNNQPQRVMDPAMANGIVPAAGYIAK